MAAPRNPENPAELGSNAGSGGTLLHTLWQIQDPGYRIQHTAYRIQDSISIGSHTCTHQIALSISSTSYGYR